MFRRIGVVLGGALLAAGLAVGPALAAPTSTPAQTASASASHPISAWLCVAGGGKVVHVGAGLHVCVGGYFHGRIVRL